ncbi:hypothetical protein BH23GEM9_BH23GEM9_17790 [soil metagenome]
MSRNALAPIAVSVGVGAATYWAISNSGLDWSMFRPATCMPDACFCEAVRGGSIRQPANTVSGFAFLPVAALVLHYRGTRRAGQSINPLRDQPAYAWLFALAITLVGIGTASYHASLTFVGQTADVFGMYLVATLLVVYNTARLRPLPLHIAASVYVFGNVLLLAVLVYAPAARRYVFAALVLTVIGLEVTVRARRRVASDRRYFVTAVAVMATGFAIWLLDITRIACVPSSLVQGHAVWHVLSASALMFVFLYYRSENAEGQA